MSDFFIELLILNSNTWNHLTLCPNWILTITQQYFEPFDCVQINELCWAEQLLLNINTCNNFNVWKQKKKQKKKRKNTLGKGMKPLILPAMG